MPPTDRSHRRSLHPLLLVSLIVATAASGPLAQDEAERIGSDTCEVCHEEVVQAFQSSPHWRTDPEGSCENCHGPGSVHMEDMDPADILRFVPQTPARERIAACFACHGRNRTHALFTDSDHALGSVACNDCHKAHEPKHVHSLRAPQLELCTECHAPIRASFALNERHPVDQGGIDCTDCHNVHEASRRNELGGFKQEMCLACHNEYRGPWVFEHEAAAVEGCLSCHMPHGSPNRHLLQYQRAGDVCLQCHPEQPFFHDLTAGDGPAPRTTGFNDCTRCHTEIHGSNNDALFLN